MKNVLNRKFIALLALVATFVLPVVAFAQDDEAVNMAVGGWVVTGIMILVIFVICVSFLAFGTGLSAAMIGYKLGKEDE